MEMLGRMFSKCRKAIRSMPDRFVRLSDRITHMGARNLIALGIMFFGAGVILYAVIIPFYIKFQNDRMVDKAREVIDQITNMDSEDLVLNGEEAGGYQGTGLSEEEFNALPPDQQAQLKSTIDKQKTIRATLNGQNILGILSIESLGLQYAIVEGTARENIRVAVGHIESTAPLGGDGNCVIAGHRGGYYGEFFKNIDKLKEGDLIVVTALTGEYTYSVYRQETIKANDWEATKMIVGEKTLTLLSCENNGTRRLAVYARMVEITKDAQGNEKITVVKSTATPPPTPTPEPTPPPPTPEPTPTPAPTPSTPIQDVTIINDFFGDVVYTGKTDMLGNWKADLPNGTYTVILRNDIGEEQTEQLVVGDGVTSQASDIIVSDSSGATVYVGRTDETGNYSIYTDDWPSGYYTFKFTNVFGKTTTETMYISQSHSDTQSSVIH